MAWRAALGPFFQRNDTRDFLPRNRHAGFAEVFSFGCIRHTRYIPGGKSVSFRFLIFEVTAACGIISGRSVPSALYLGKFVGTIHIPILGTVKSWGSTTQPLILNEPSSAMGIPIAEDGSFKIKGWVVDPHDLTVPNIGIWIVPTNFPKYSAEGTDLPEIIPQAAVTSKIKNRK